MKAIKIMCVVAAIMIISGAAIAIDIRTFGLEFQQNKQDERKNTFLHNLAFECEDFDDWSEVMHRVELFMNDNQNWMPNPFIQNNNGKTAKEETKKNFKKTGNPVCGVLAIYFKQMEDNCLNKLAIKKNR